MVMPYGARVPAQTMPYERGGNNPLAEALSSMAPQIQPPMPTPPPQGGGGIEWEQLLKLLPLILAGMKGGMPAVGGYASGLAQGERQNQMLGMRQDELAYGREQDAMQRERQADQDERQAREDRYRELERARQQQRDMLKDLQGEAGAAMATAPYADEQVEDVPIPATVTPETRVYSQVEQAGREMGADPALVRRVGGQIPAAMSQRKKTAAMSVLKGLEGKDPASYAGQRFMDGLTVEQIKALAGDAGAGFGLPDQQDPVNQQIKETAGGGFVGINPRDLTVTPIEGVRAPQPASAAPGVSGGLSPDALDMVATLYAKTGQLPPLGMGAAAAGLRQQIITRAAELAKGTDLASSISGFKANQSSLTMLTKRRDAIRAYSRQAEASLRNAGQAIQDVRMRSSLPAVNRVRNWAAKNFADDPALSRAEVFIYNAARDYARVTSGGVESIAQLTDTASTKADELLDAAKSPQAFQSALDAMLQDMTAFKQSAEQEVQEVQGRIRGGGGQGEATPEAARGGRSALKNRLRGGQ